MKIYIQQAHRGQRVFKDFTEAWVQCFLKELKKNNSLKNREFLNLQEVSLVYLDSKAIKLLNKKYRNKNKATDVLSFFGDGFVSLGEVILCQEELKKKANQSSLNLKIFTQLMICHSLLHLFGYTHEDSLESEEEMLSIQNKTLKKVASKLAPLNKNMLEV